jgi:hypothetical protein
MVLGNTDVTKWAFGIPTTAAGNALQVGNSSANGNGAFLTNGGTWTNASSRDFKDQFADINGDELLEKVNQLNIQKWNYKGTDESHIGPIAEEFKELFDVGVKDDKKHISTIDASGVALKAIQELNKKLAEKDRKIGQMSKENQQLSDRIEKLEKLVNSLIEKK